MEPHEILHEIVKTDLEARALYDETVRQQDELQQSLCQKIDELRRSCFAEAGRRLGDFEKLEIERADAEIREIDRQYDAAIEDVRGHFEREKEQIALQMFNLVIGRSE